MSSAQVEKTYYAVCQGELSGDGTVEAPIGLEPGSKIRRCCREDGQPAVTHWQVLASQEGHTLLRLRLETGRTHQIRVHMAYLGHPVAGDPVYGPKKGITSLEGQCLHAGKIGFVHPRTGEYLEFEAPLPAYFTGFLQKLKEV